MAIQSQYFHTYYQAHKEQHWRTGEAWRIAHPEQDEAIQARYRRSSKYRKTRREYAQRIKTEVFRYYGGDPSKCACCDEDTLVFLTIDHINGGGSEHKRKVLGSDKGGINLYFWLKKNRYPEGFQVLCWNCNAAKGILGYCPHQTEVGLSRVQEIFKE